VQLSEICNKQKYGINKHKYCTEYYSPEQYIMCIVQLCLKYIEFINTTTGMS